MRVCVCVLVFVAKGNLGEEHLALLSTVLPLDRPVGTVGMYGYSSGPVTSLSMAVEKRLACL